MVHTDLFQSGSWTALIGICGAGAFALFVVFRIVDERRWGGIALSAGALAVVGVIVGPALASSLLTSDELPSGARKAMEVGARNIRPLEFRERPNVYFVGFDSLVPKSIMQNYMGIETTDLHELFDSEMRRFRNFFANGDSTKASFNILMSLDGAIMEEGYKERLGGYNPGFFSGQSPSPLVEIMKHNGYETTSIFNDAYFGYPKRAICRQLHGPVGGERSMCPAGRQRSNGWPSGDTAASASLTSSSVPVWTMRRGAGAHGLTVGSLASWRVGSPSPEATIWCGS